MKFATRAFPWILSLSLSSISIWNPLDVTPSAEDVWIMLIEMVTRLVKLQIVAFPIIPVEHQRSTPPPPKLHSREIAFAFTKKKKKMHSLAFHYQKIYLFNAIDLYGNMLRANTACGAYGSFNRRYVAISLFAICALQTRERIRRNSILLGS